MRHELRLFLIALQFLTRVPVPRNTGFHADWLNDSARHFPAVGLSVGAFGAAVLWGAAQLFPAAVAVLLSMAATVWLTGAFHEDGLADTCDALGGAVSRERALAIMKDSRIGSYGTVGLILVLAIKAAALHGLAVRNLDAALVAVALAHALSRLAPVLLLRWLPYGGDADAAKAKPMAQRISGTSAAVALGWCSAALVAAWGWGLTIGALWAASASVFVVAAVLTVWLQRRLGGYTGDTLGAAQQGAELAVLLSVLGSF